MDFSMLNKLLPPPLTNPFYRTPGEALDAVIRPIQEQTGIPGSYQYIEQGLQKLLQPKTPMQRAKVGQPMVLGGRLGYKAADGSWQPRADMESENIPQYAQGKGYVYDEPQARRKPKEDSREPGTTTPPAPRVSPEERAYNAERARIAQLTEQNPEFQNIGKLRNDLRDQGMAIWAAKYGGPGGLAERVKPGQVGYDVIQGVLAAPTLEQAPVQVAPGEIPYQQGDLGTRATLETGYDPAQYGLSPHLVEEMKKRLLQQAGK